MVTVILRLSEFMLYTIPPVEGQIITEHKLPWPTFFERMLYLFLYLTAIFIIEGHIYKISSSRIRFSSTFTDVF